MLALLDYKKLYILILLFIIILYGETIYYGYIWDDFDLVILKFQDIIDLTLNSYLIRPVMFLSYFLSNFFYSSSVLDHIVNIVLFALAAKLVFDFTIKTHNKLAAFFIMIVWISLPWLSHTIIWISQRNDTLMIIFSMLAIKYDGNKQTLKSCVFLFLSVFSKITSFLLPLFLIYKNRKNKKKVLIYSFIQTIFLSIGLISFLREGTKKPHLAELSFFESVILKFFHVFEGVLTQVIPFPYFFNQVHFIIYAVILIVVLIVLKYNHIITSQKKDLAILFLIFSIPLAINSELRIAIASSYFLISLVFLSVKLNNLSKIFLLVFLAHNIWVTTVSKTNYFSGAYTLTNYVHSHPENMFYNNSFYKEKRQFLIKTKEEVWDNWMGKIKIKE